MKGCFTYRIVDLAPALSCVSEARTSAIRLRRKARLTSRCEKRQLDPPTLERLCRILLHIENHLRLQSQSEPDNDILSAFTAPWRPKSLVEAQSMDTIPPFPSLLTHGLSNRPKIWTR